MNLAPQQRLGRLVLLEKTARSGVTAWKCRCDCGTEKVVRQDHLKAGYTRSCGCQSTKAHHRAMARVMEGRQPA